MLNHRSVTIGADPEVFFNDKKELVSAIGLIGGSKESPLTVARGYAILEDNVAAEFNVPAATTEAGFNKTIEQGLAYVEHVAKKHKLVISRQASGIFAPKWLEDKAAQEFGCEPDYNAWSGEVNEKPVSTNGFRTAGGHVHVGGVSNMNIIYLVRALDLFLGVPSLVLDSDKERRTLYGKAGCFRPKEYGVEYRSLSNFWVFEPVLRKWVWNAVLNAIEFAESNLIELTDPVSDLIQSAINETNMDAFGILVKEFPLIDPSKVVDGLAALKK